MKHQTENDALASLLRSGSPIQAVRVAGWFVGAMLAICAALLMVHHVPGTDPFMSLLALVSALWLAWFVFDFAMRPMQAQPAPPPTREDFADTVAGWQHQE